MLVAILGLQSRIKYSSVFVIQLYHTERELKIPKYLLSDCKPERAGDRVHYYNRKTQKLNLFVFLCIFGA